MTMISILKSKIHRATNTDANLDYTSSITLDPDLMDAAGLAEYEKVLVANIPMDTGWKPTQSRDGGEQVKSV